MMGDQLKFSELTVSVSLNYIQETNNNFLPLPLYPIPPTSSAINQIYSFCYSLTRDVGASERKRGFKIIESSLSSSDGVMSSE